MKKYLELKGIEHEMTAPFTPEQNGKAERDNRTIIECAGTLLHAKNLPKILWAEAIAYAVYVLNRIVNRKDGNVSPYELWTGKTPDLSNLKTFGSDAYIHVPKLFRRKWDRKAEKGIFVGFQGESGNMRVYLPITKAIKESKDVTIHETDVLNDGKEHKVQVKIPVNDDVTHNQTIEEDDDYEPINEQVSDKQIPRRSQRQRRPPERYEAHWAAIEEPKTYVEAVTGTDRLQWERAIK